MNKLELFVALRKHRKLSEQRHFDSQRNKYARWLLYFGVAYFTICMLMFAICISMAANEMKSMSTIEFLFCLAPFLAVIDFGLRFIVQDTPSQIVKPYILLSIPKYTCVDFFIISQMMDVANLAWFVIIIPYCIMSVVFSYGLTTCIAILFLFWIIELIVSQFYLIVRTLVNDTLLWWLLPAGVLLMSMLPGFQWEYTYTGGSFFSFDDWILFYGKIGIGVEGGKMWPYLLLMALFVIVTQINRKVQYAHVKSEVMRKEKEMKIGTTDSLSFLNRLGDLGLYIALEMKSNWRNKNPHKSFIRSICIVCVFSVIIIFTDVYDAAYMKNFWCLYDYTIFGAMTLSGIMCSEGNYIDGLMVRRENILQILRAKYWFNCTFLLLPFCLMLPTVISGKWSLLMVVAYGVFTAGFQFFLLCQLAVVNRTCMPLNTKLTSKDGNGNNLWVAVVVTFCLIAPVCLASLLQSVFSDNIAYILMLVIGAAFIATHHLWLRNIYNRFMKRRYENMEGFRSTRS